MQEACKLSSNVLLISDAHRQLTFNDAGRKKFKLLGGKKMKMSKRVELVESLLLQLMKNVCEEMSFSPKYKPITAELGSMALFASKRGLESRAASHKLN
jgi:hypothetical protein